MVYDTRHDDDIRNRQVSDDDLRDITGIDRSQEQDMERGATNGAAADILGRERAAAAGKMATQTNGVANPKSSITRGGLGVPSQKPAESTIQRGGLGGTRRNLGNKENDSLYKPSADSEPAPKSRIKRLLGSGGKRRRLALAGLLSALVGGGGGFAVFGVISGPLQILQLGESLSQFHLSEKERQGDSRANKVIRTIRAALNNETMERTRLGFIGNHVADKVTKKMEARGFTMNYQNGRFTGYTIDPKKLSSADYPDLHDRSPEGVARYFEEKYGMKAEVAGAVIALQSAGSYFKQTRLFKQVLKITGLKWASPLAMRTVGVRANFGFHWWKVLKGETLDEKYQSWAKKKIEDIKRGSKPPTASASKQNENGENVDDPDTQGIKEIQEAGNEASQELQAGEGKTEKMEKLKSLIGGKLGPGAAGAFGFLCFLYSLSQQIDAINQKNVIEPMMRMGMEAVSKSSQLQDNLDVDIRQMGWDAELLHDKETGDWSNGRSVQAEFGRAMSGPDISPNAKINPEGNMITRIIAQVPGLETACQVAGSTIVMIAITIISFTIIPVGTLITTAIGLALGPLIMDWLANIFANNVVDPMAKGAERGNLMNYGVRLAANDLSVSRGGLPLTPADEAAIAQANQSDIQQEFNQKNLAYRLFSPDDPKSFIAQVMRSQDPNPAQNLSNVATSFLGMGKSFSSALAGIASRPASAATPRAYDYGFPDYAFSPSEMDSVELEDPFVNANRVANILDANESVSPTTPVTNEPNLDNYIARAKVCFGVDIVKQNVTVGEEGNERQVEQYSIKAPAADSIPLRGVMMENGGNNKCTEGSNYATQGGGVINDWTRIRMYIFDSQVMNAIGCLEGDEEDEVAKQACVDIGLDGGSSGMAWDDSTGVPTCNTTAISAAPPGYKLTSCDDFEGTSLDGSTFTAYNGGGGNTVSGRGRVASQCTVANSFLTLTQGPDGATCGTTSNFNQKEGYWEVRMRTAAIDGGDSTAHPVLILWPGSDVWADGELDYFETDIGKDGGGFLHCVGNPSANCLVIPGNSGNKAITPTADDYKAKNAKSYFNWHSYGLMWKPDSMSGYIDGQQWWTSTDGSFRPRVPMHQTIQLDNLSGDGSPNPAQMQADWVHVYAPN